ncbi:hypothetical protein ACHAWF_002408 [Thalassiosira exigua]
MEVGNMKKGRECMDLMKSSSVESEMYTGGMEDLRKLVMSAFGEEIDDADNIAIAKSMYESAVKMNGKDSRLAIQQSAWVGDALAKAHMFEESLAWLKDSYERSKRVFGVHHVDTFKIRRRFLMINTGSGRRSGTLVMADKKNKLNGKEVTILRATKDNKKYVVEIEQETGSWQKFKVAPANLICTVDTPITFNDKGEVFTAFVESFDARKDTYKILAMSGVSDNDAHCFIQAKRKDVTVMFPNPLQQAFFGMM